MSEGLDLDKLGTSLSDDGVEMQVRHPGTGQPIEGMFITLRGSNSDAVRKAQRRIADRYLKERNQGRRTLSQDELENDSIEILVAAVAGWRGEAWKLNGEALPYSPDNARKVFSDKKFAWLERQCRAFFAEDSNFIPA